jgi:hypothetical protein
VVACDGRWHKGCRTAFRRSAALADVVASPKQNGCMETHCVADDAVGCELVSAPNSLLTGKLTGNFANSGPQQRFPHLINELIQSLAAKFPTQRNREFLQP